MSRKSKINPEIIAVMGNIKENPNSEHMGYIEDIFLQL
jgi:hypothetical protein